MGSENLSPISVHKCARARQERRLKILEGISRGLKQSGIAAQLRVERWIIKNDIRCMRDTGDPEFKHALEAQERIRERTEALMSDDRFLDMTGMTIQEKSFRNMIEYNRHELLKILNSENQHAAIMRLPKSIRKTLKKMESSLMSGKSVRSLPKLVTTSKQENKTIHEYM